MCLWQVSLAGDSGSLIGHLLMTFSGSPNVDVADSLDGAYLGPFKSSNLRKADLSTKTRVVVLILLYNVSYFNTINFYQSSGTLSAESA